MTPDEPRTLEEVYARIPAVACKGLCVDSCGPIAMSVDEEARLHERGVKVPPLPDAVAAVERGEDYYCPALEDGRCRVYDVRPTICRLWGATRSMPCPHGCTPPDALSQERSHELLRLAAAVGGGMPDDSADPDDTAGPASSRRDRRRRLFRRG